MEVRIEHLTKTFIGKKGIKTTAVNDMSFVVPDGKLVGLLGPSGCGKSTTLYMIAGLHKPTDGHIWFGDEDVTNVPPENRGIGLVFQNYALYPHFSVKQNITFPLDNVRFPHPLDAYKTGVKEASSKLKKAQKAVAAAEKAQAENLEEKKAAVAEAEQELQRAQEALEKATAELAEIKEKDPERYAQLTKKRLTKEEKDEIAHKMARLVDIEPYLERKPKELSGGQQQRVAIARALAKSPRVLLLDEPLSNLDARLRLQTREEIRRIQKETGITTIFVTHDQEEAMSISDVIVVMNFGVINQIDEPQKVYDEPANLFVAKFLGSPAINIFDGEIKGGKLYVAGELFDDDKVYAKEYHGVIHHEYQFVKGTRQTLDEYLADLKEHPEWLEGKEKKEIKALENPEIEIVHEDEEVVKEDRKVKIGVRPEAFTYNKKGKLPIDVQFVQHVGRDVSVIGRVKEQEGGMKIIIPSESWKDVVGQNELRFDPKRFYVFEESGERIK